VNLTVDSAGLPDRQGTSLTSKPKIPVILGPTAIGKTEIGIKVGIELNAEIISADSRQIYKYMNIGTAKPTLDEIARCRHHMIDFLDPEEVFSAGDFVRKAVEAAQEIIGRGRIPVLVGGAGLYIKALTEGIFAGDSSEPEIRERLNWEYESGRAEEMLEHLRILDPDYAGLVHVNDKKKLVRALEIYQVSGYTISELKEHQGEGEVEGILCGLGMDREKLYYRINHRVDSMLEAGLVKEVENLRNRGLTKDHNSMKSPGYKEVLDYLDGNISRGDMIEMIKRNTRRYAKRQITWFGKMKDIEWFDLNEGIEHVIPGIIDYITQNIKE